MKAYCQGRQAEHILFSSLLSRSVGLHLDSCPGPCTFWGGQLRRCPLPAGLLGLAHRGLRDLASACFSSPICWMSSRSPGRGRSQNPLCLRRA